MGGWLADDASGVSNLTPRLGTGQGSLCSPLPQPLLPQGTDTQGRFQLPRSPDRWDWEQTPSPPCQPPPPGPGHPPGLTCPLTVPFPPPSPQNATIQGAGLRAAALPVAPVAEQSRLQHGRYVSPNRAPGM